MVDINHKFPIAGSLSEVFEAISTPAGLDSWWTLESEGEPYGECEYRFFFSEENDWRAEVTHVETDRSIEWVFTEAMPNWTGTRLRIDLEDKEGLTWVTFLHSGWETDGEHYRISCFCWAMYLRLLKKYVETGTTIPYAERLDA